MNSNQDDVSPEAPVEQSRVVAVHRGYEIIERSASPSVVSAGGHKLKYIAVEPGTGKPVWRECQTLKQAKQMINFQLAQKVPPA